MLMVNITASVKMRKYFATFYGSEMHLDEIKFRLWGRTLSFKISIFYVYIDVGRFYLKP